MTDSNHDVERILSDWEYQAQEMDARNPMRGQILAEAATIRSALSRVTAERDAAVAAAEAEGEESYQIGLRDGYEQGVQKADEVTGGNGEYICCVGADPDDRHCPGPAEMLKRMAERWDAALHAPEPAPAAGDVVSRAAVIPDLTCPDIDAAIAALEKIRDDNSQMRYGYWHMHEELAELRALHAPAGEPAQKWVFDFTGSEWVLQAHLSDMPLSIHAGMRVELFSAPPAAPAGEPVAWQPMDMAPRERTPVLARIRRDLEAYHPTYGFGNARLYAGLTVVVSSRGMTQDGFETGWDLHGPFGHGLGGDDIFEGWMPIPAAPAQEGQS